MLKPIRPQALRIALYVLMSVFCAGGAVGQQLTPSTFRRVASSRSECSASNETHSADAPVAGSTLGVQDNSDVVPFSVRQISVGIVGSHLSAQGSPRQLASSLPVYVVNTAANVPANKDELTLQGAVSLANGTGGSIVFDIPGPGPHIIQPTFLTAIPALSGNSITIDGGGDIQISGLSSLPSAIAFDLQGNNNTLCHLQICCFNRAVRITGGTANTIENCSIGAGNFVGIEILNAPGNTIGPGNQSSSNSTMGLLICGPLSTANHIVGNEFSFNNNAGIDIIGGASANIIGPSNVIGVNSWAGIQLLGAGAANIIQGNHIGTNSNSAPGIGNLNDGIALGSGVADTDVYNNVISGNNWSGVHVVGVSSNSNHIHDNRIGVNASGTIALSNGQHGVALHNGASSNEVGPDNIISGNTWSGVAIYANGDATNANIVHDNIIGTNLSTTAEIPNQLHGVSLFLGTTENVVGPGNIIAGNLLQGVTIGGAGTDSNDVVNNEIGIAGVGNHHYGCRVNGGAVDNHIGPDNKIRVNRTGGILLADANTVANIITRNEIGGDTEAMGNLGPGVTISAGAHSNTIGKSFFASGSEIGEPNTIANNAGNGVLVLDDSPRNTIRKNSIYANSDAGIKIELPTLTALPPDILPLTPLPFQNVAGYTTAPVNSVVDFYLTPDAANQGKTYVGSVSVIDSQVSEFYTFFSRFIQLGNLKLTATVTSTDRTTSAFGRPESRRVMFPNGTPIEGAKVYAYRLSFGTVFKLDESSGECGAAGIVTDENGHYARPPAFTLREANPPKCDMALGVLAEITYTDPGLEAVRPGEGEATIVNYPSFDSLKPRSLRMTGYEDIVVPYPTILHTGLLSGIPGFDALRDYLRCNAAGHGVLGCTVGNSKGLSKQDLRIPAFITFSMPSRGGIIAPCPNSWSWCRAFLNWRGDNVSWGYDSSAPMTPAQHDENARALQLFINNQMGTVMQALVPDPQQRAALPINMCAHSMGGQITRAWRYLYGATGPPVAQYVSFDGVHGGTTLAELSGGMVTGFAEWMVNGFNPLNDSEPIIKGWNYLRSIGTSKRNLLMSSSCSTCLIVDPNDSAFGVGRTMRGPPGLLFLLHTLANGHRARFIGGWELNTQRFHTKITSDADAVVAAAKFMAYGVPPSGVTMSQPLQASGSAASIGASTTDIAEVTHSLTADPGVPASVDIFIGPTPSARLSVLLAGAGALFDLLDENAQSVLPIATEVLGIAENVDNRMYILQNPIPGQYTALVEAGSETAAAIVDLSFETDRTLNLSLPQGLVEPDDPVTILADLQASGGQIVVPDSGVMEVNINGPDGATWPLQLFDDGAHGDGTDGDGVYGTVFLDTTAGGRYLVTAHALVQADGDPVERTTVEPFVVTISSAELLTVSAERPIDSDGNGLFDHLAIDLDIDIIKPGKFQVMATLIDDIGEEILHDRVAFDALAAGPMTVSFVIEAARLVAHARPGPWTLTGLRLIDDEEFLLTDTLSDYLTVARDLAEFDSPPSPKVLRAVPDYGVLTGGNEIILEGQNFDYVGTVVLGGGVIKDFDILNDTTLRFNAPPSAICAPNTFVAIEVANPWHTSTKTDAYQYVDQPSGDWDNDCDIDLVDFGAFQRCFTGTTGGGLGAGCNELDIDGNDVIDLLDYGLFISNATGPL